MQLNNMQCGTLCFLEGSLEDEKRLVLREDGMNKIHTLYGTTGMPVPCSPYHLLFFISVILIDYNTLGHS